MGFKRKKHVNKKHKPREGSWHMFKQNFRSYPGVMQKFDDMGCYNWLRMKSFMWSGFVLGMIIMITFLPVRLLFYTYVSPNWLGNLGLLSLIAAMTFAIVYYGRDKKNLIGKFSLAYRQRMSRFVHRKRSVPLFLGMQAVVIMVYISIFYASTEDIQIDDTPGTNEAAMRYMYTMSPAGYEQDMDNSNVNIYDRVKNMDVEEISDGSFSTEFQSLMQNLAFSQNAELKEQMYEHYKNSRHTDEKFEVQVEDVAELFSGMPKSMNTFSDGWSSHFLAVWLLADIEYSALFFVYRRIYRKVDVGLPWEAVAAWKNHRGGFVYPVELIKEYKKR